MRTKDTDEAGRKYCAGTPENQECAKVCFIKELKCIKFLANRYKTKRVNKLETFKQELKEYIPSRIKYV